MNLEQLANVGEFLGGVAVVVSLIYLAVQIRQNTNSVRAQAELGMNTRFADWHGRVNDHPDLSRIWDTATEDSENMSDEDIRRYRWLIAELFLIYEGWFQLYLRSGISDSSWNTKMDALKVLLDHPVISEWWESRMTPLSDEFRDHLNHLRTTDSSWSHQRISGRGSDA